MRVLTRMLCFVLLLTSLLLARTQLAHAQSCTAETEPNDQPAQAAKISGAVCLSGEEKGNDQDIFAWTVSEADAKQRWDFTLQPIQGALTNVQIVRVTFAANGADVADSAKLYTFGTADGQAVSAKDLLFVPGTYYIGVVHSGNDGKYQLTIQPRAALPPNGDVEPNDDANTATALPQTTVATETISLSGDLNGSEDNYRWTVTEQAATQRWRITAQASLGETGTVYLYDSQNNQLVYQDFANGLVDLNHLGLAAGEYTIRLTPAKDHSTPYLLALEPAGNRFSLHEEEPNDDPAHAYPLDLTQPMAGSFPDGHVDLDVFKLTISDTLAAQQWNVTTTSSTEANFELCLLNAKGDSLQCRQGSKPSLSDLVLQPGDYFVSFRNRDNMAADYTIQFEENGEPATATESEPNDQVTLASPMSEDNAIQGRFAGEEDDYLRFTIPGPAQLWRIQAVGEGVAYLSLVEIDGNEDARATATPDGRARIDDVYLLPGDHFLRIHGTDGQYTVRVIPLGPPTENVTIDGVVLSGTVTSAAIINAVAASSADASSLSISVTEKEPNDDTSEAERLAFGVPRSGRVTTIEDHDFYRFYLAGREHIRLTVLQPVDGRLDIALEDVFSRGGRTDGSPVIYETVLGPGDHFIRINAAQPSDNPYIVLLERLDPLTLPFDREPDNNTRETAVPLPATLLVTGTVNQSEDPVDWYRAPASSSATTMTISAPPTATLEVRAGDNILAASNVDRAQGTADYAIPAGQPLDIGVSGNLAYTLSVAYRNGPSAQPAARPLPLSIKLSAPVAAVAGFWHEGQQLELNIALTNTGQSDLALTLATASSDFAWSPTLKETTVNLKAGEARTLPLTVKILPDAPIDLSPRFTVRAIDKTGAFVTAALELPAVCGAPPVNPNGSWTTAGALLGGLNVAWRGLGSEPINDKNNDHLFDLFDEIVSPAFGWNGQPDERLTVKLAGDAPMPVAGVLLNPFSRVAPNNQLRHFAVLLSDDGQQFNVAYTGELAQVQMEQSFVFTQPIAARYAQLQLIDNWGNAGDIGIGEFKVMAASNYKPNIVFNLLDPAHGGHVVSGSPLLDNLQKLVTAEADHPSASVGDNPPPAEWVVGFHHDRAAQITALHWRNQADGKPEQRFSQVDVQVSTDSPVGPWQALKTWTLDPASTETQTLPLEQPVWARFVRFVAQPPANASTFEYPDQLAIDERPIDDSYRSILAEWGGYRQEAIFEQLQAEHPIGSQLTETEPNDNRATAQALAADQPVKGATLVGKDDDWFKLTGPNGVNTINVALRGDPIVSVDSELVDSNGAPISYTTQFTNGALRLKAPATPGDYYLHVFDPKRSIVFSWDTSGSVGPYLTQIYQSLTTFTHAIDEQFEVVNLLPFGDPGQFLRKEWSGDPVAVQTAFNNDPRNVSSSSAETNLLAASTALGERAGTRAVVLMTDAESSSYDKTEALWQALTTVRPRVFSFEISSGGNPYSQDLMQDWAAVNRGHYENLSTIGLFEQGFARTTCLLRRPAEYQVEVKYTNEAPPPTPTPAPTATSTETPTPAPTTTPTATSTPQAPGTLRVVGQTTSAGQPAQVIGGGAVELILDASGSMLQVIDGKQKIAIARAVLNKLVTNVLPPNTPMALRVFGHKEAGSCRTDLEIPLQALDAASVTKTIASINAKNLAKTPIADSLKLVVQDLANATGQKVVILVTDGEETCGGNPEQEIKTLRSQGIDVRINIVGFDVDDPALKETFQRWATEGGGSYFNASNAAELDVAVTNALRAPFRVLDVNGNEVAQGAVNGEPVSLSPGTYTVEVLTEPVQRLEQVVIHGGESATVEVTSQ
ncbi:MAG: VWA domain-containing protein [Caldilineaceae bacterium]